VLSSLLKGLSVGNNPIDFSVGLELSLELLGRYRQSGLLHAEIPRVPGVRGVCHAWISLVQGKVTFCYIESSTGQRYQADKATLSQMDAERGPFNWALAVQTSPEPQTPLPAPLTPTPPQAPLVLGPSRSVRTQAVPRSIAVLDLARLANVPNRERMVLRLVFTMVDGRRTIEEIKARLTLSNDVVDWALQTLVSMSILVIDQQ